MSSRLVASDRSLLVRDSDVDLPDSDLPLKCRLIPHWCRGCLLSSHESCGAPWLSRQGSIDREHSHRFPERCLAPVNSVFPLSSYSPDLPPCHRLGQGSQVVVLLWSALLIKA